MADYFQSPLGLASVILSNVSPILGSNVDPPCFRTRLSVSELSGKGYYPLSQPPGLSLRLSPGGGEKIVKVYPDFNYVTFIAPN